MVRSSTKLRSAGTEKPKLSAFDMALRNLRRLFPKSSLVIELEKKLAPKPKPASAKTVSVGLVASVKCSERGCVFPSVINGRCRQHAADAIAEWSLVPCASEPMVSGLRGRWA